MFQPKTGEFTLFIDESGSPKPNPNDAAKYFALGGVLLEREDEESVASEVSALKRRWNLSEDTPLHGNEIRSKKKNFAWLGKRSEVEQNEFMSDLSNTITALPIIVHACVVSRTGYLERYLERYGSETWEMMKSAFTILIERSAKYAAKHNGSIMIYYEEAGKKEDQLIKQYFTDLRSSGHPFDSVIASQYRERSEFCVSGLESKRIRRPHHAKTEESPKPSR